MTWGAYLAASMLAFVLAVTGGAAMEPLGPFSFGWQLIVALLLAAALTAALALAVDWLLFRRLRRDNAITLVIASFGAALALRNLVQFLYGTLPDYYTREIQIAIRLVPSGMLGDVLGGLRITPDQMLVIGTTLAAMLALQALLTRTTLGRAMRATAMNPALARVAGVDVEGVIRATWVIGAALAAMAGVFAGIVGQIRPGLGFELLLPLFAAAILGGIGSVRGAVAGGYIIGLAESLSVPLVGAEYRAATAFAVLIVILLLRPNGLFGERA
ncbi:MAG TPA: branched-chain amino acid ABC transporter permease [Falsiroseomonas sp.]|jgi:branched-chain amino acid transport system permease protein|nr:branched-chain amino acid ABC transporter permease [Falsiroseomonas sp.]